MGKMGGIEGDGEEGGYMAGGSRDQKNPRPEARVLRLVASGNALFAVLLFFFPALLLLLLLLDGLLDVHAGVPVG